VFQQLQACQPNRFPALGIDLVWLDIQADV
jgi:hypothetical protein